MLCALPIRLWVELSQNLPRRARIGETMYSVEYTFYMSGGFSYNGHGLL